MSLGDADSTSDPDPAASPPKSPPGSSEAPQPRWPRLAVIPPLAQLAALAALCHVVLQHVLFPLLSSRGLALPTILRFAAPYALNLAACAGLIALTAGALDLARARDLTYAGRRFMIGVLAGIVVATVSLATFLPNGHVSPQLVLLAAGSLHIYVVQIALTTLRAHHSLAGRTTVGLVAASALFPLTSLIMRHAEPIARWPFAQEGVASLHALGELAYLIVPIAAAFTVMPWGDDDEGRAARRAGAVAVILMALLFGAAARIPNALYGHVMYSTLRLEWALERASLGYAVPISLAVGAAMAASASRDPRHRQGGAGLWLWLAGGYNPLTPSRVFMAALAATLLCRAILSAGTETNKKTS